MPMMSRMSVSFFSHRLTCRLSPSTSLHVPHHSVADVKLDALLFRGQGRYISVAAQASGVGFSPGWSGVGCEAGDGGGFVRRASSVRGQGLAEVMSVDECAEVVDEIDDCERDSVAVAGMAGLDGQDESVRERSAKRKLEGGLYLVATPIGNLEDMTFRAVRVLKAAEVILAEDTRHSARLLQHYGITTPMMSYHKFNEFARQNATVQRLKLGGILALISDAGMPGISDPGTELVMACVEANVPVHPVPGASAVVTALVASGLPTDEFTFVGFLPTQATAKRRKLAVASRQTATQIFYVPPHKLTRILDDCASAFGASRRCVVAREMTKLHEEFWRGTISQAQEEFAERNPRGEMTLVVEGLSLKSAEELPSEEDIESELQILMAAGVSLSEACRQVVEGTGMRRKAVYALALKLSKSL